MSLLSTTAQAAGLTALVTLAFVAAGFVFFTNVGGPVVPVPVTNSAGAGIQARGPAPPQSAPTALGQTPTPHTLSGGEAISPRLNVAGVSVAGERAGQVESATKIEGANDAPAQGPGLPGGDNYFAQPEAPASAEAGGSATPPPAAANVAPAAGAATERPRPKTAGELTRPLSAMGHRVHATLSGDGPSTTLSISGATLTKEDAVRWLGSAGARRELKAAGVRIVVLVSGGESWTFML